MDKKCRKQVSSAVFERVSSRIRDSCIRKSQTLIFGSSKSSTRVICLSDKKDAAIERNVQHIRYVTNLVSCKISKIRNMEV